jgi:hypothetical protein
VRLLTGNLTSDRTPCTLPEGTPTRGLGRSTVGGKQSGDGRGPGDLFGQAGSNSSINSHRWSNETDLHLVTLINIDSADPIRSFNVSTYGVRMLGNPGDVTSASARRTSRWSS